jgi:Vitamin K-dependent gamma-carboxylase
MKSSRTRSGALAASPLVPPRCDWMVLLQDSLEAKQLAALRIVVPAMILCTPEVRHAVLLANVPAALRVAPEGLGWFLASIPIGPRITTAVQAVCVFSALMAMVGLRARIALAALSATTYYLFALAQFSGQVWHDMHLLWMSCLLAASPCDSAWTYDPPVPISAERATALRVSLNLARVLLGCVYVFPGIHKLKTSGLAWALSDNLRNQLWWKWAEHDIVPTLRVDRAPFILHAAGLFVLAFELSFPLLALARRTRVLAAVLGGAFHILAAYFFRIPFVSLPALYVVLVNPAPLVEKTYRRPPATLTEAPRRTGPWPVWVTYLVGMALVLGATIQGLRGQMRSFPFACYPTFEWIVGTEMPDLQVVALGADGRRIVVPHGRRPGAYRSQRDWGEVFSLVGMWGPASPDRAQAYVSQLASRDAATRRALAGAERIQLYKVEVSVNPDQRDRPPSSETLLFELDASPLGP